MELACQVSSLLLYVVVIKPWFSKRFFFFFNEEVMCTSCERVCEKPSLTAVRQGGPASCRGKVDSLGWWRAVSD